MGTVPIRIEATTKTRLDSIKAYLAKHRKGRVTYDDAIQSLFKKLTELRKEIRVLTSSDASPSPQTQELQKPEERPTPEQAPVPLVTCDFRTDLGQGIIHCSKDFDRKGIIHKINDEICQKCWNRQEALQQEQTVLAEKTPCLSRYEHHGQHFCLKKPPNPIPLPHGLKTCAHCRDRLTKEIAEAQGLITRTVPYVTCGAKQKHDERVGMMLLCPKAGQWTTMKMCQEIACPDFKIVETRQKVT